MMSRDDAVRLNRFEADEKTRQVSELEYMIREFDQLASDLELQVQIEEARTGIKDPRHFRYSTYAMSAAYRRDNLRASVTDLRERLQTAIRERDGALATVAAAPAPAHCHQVSGVGCQVSETTSLTDT